jgi:hypothetical protein
LSANTDTWYFINNIKNIHFFFTSLYCHLNSATSNLTKHSGVYTFSAHSQISQHRLFGREDGKEPRHLELHFYDDDPNLEHRTEGLVNCSGEKTKKLFRAWLSSFMTTHDHILGVWVRLNTSRTIISH